MKVSVKILTFGLAHLTATVLGAAELSGRVGDVTGGPLHFTTVEIRREGDSKGIGSAFTDLSGRFHFANLAADTYQLSFKCMGFLTAKVVRTVQVDEVIVLGDIVLQVAPIEGCPDSWDRPTILLKEIKGGAELRGKAEERGGTPLRRVTVTLEGKDHNYRTSTDADGAFNFAKIKPGLYTLHVVEPGFAEFRIDGIRLMDRHRSDISDALQLPRCPDNVKCQPVRKVLKVNICL